MMTRTQRRVAIGLQIMIVIGLVLIGIFQIAMASPIVSIIWNIAGIAIAGALLWAMLRGRRHAPLMSVLMSALLSGMVPPAPLFSVGALLSLLVSPVTALIYGRAWWVLATALTTLVIFAVRAGWSGLTDAPSFYVLYVLIVGGMALARSVTDSALAEAQASARQAEAARADAERQTQGLAVANQHMEEQIAQQRHLLDLVAQLETPVSPLAAGVLYVPIIGALDTRRAQALTSRVLAAAAEQRARLVILDIAGLPQIDSAVAQALLQTAQALRLLGCRVTLSGISAAVAITLADLELDLADVATVRSPQEALAAFAQA